MLRNWSSELLVRVVVVAAEARKEEAGGSSETSAGRNWCWRGREVTEEATVGKLPSTLELGPEVIALAEQRRRTVGLQVVQKRGRSRLHLPRLVLG